MQINKGHSSHKLKKKKKNQKKKRKIKQKCPFSIFFHFLLPNLQRWYLNIFFLHEYQKEKKKKRVKKRKQNEKTTQ